MDMYTPKSKKIMSKEETALLIDLIQSNPILTSKETNATTNKIKEETWTVFVPSFNAKSGSFPRTKERLKLKWDNLKKAARKRSQLIRMNNLKTGKGKPDIIPVDEILEKVTSLLGSTCSRFVVPVGGDSVSGVSIMVLDANDETDIVDNNDASEGLCIDARPNVPDVEILCETPSKGKRNADNDGRLARNLAIARYYDKKTEILDLEIKILRLQLDKENKNNVSNNG